MFASRKWRYFEFTLAAISVVTVLRAQSVEMHSHHSRQTGCFYSGPWAIWEEPEISPCGTKGFARVFTGTVKSAVDTSDYETLLTIVPDEIFSGDRIDEVTATVVQSCALPGYPDIQAGDKWLFYLAVNRPAQIQGKPDHLSSELTIPFFSPTKPLSQAGDDIATLRHLAQHPDSAFITGNVKHLGETYDKQPVPAANHKIVAKGTLGHEQVAVTDDHGHYEFELPADAYDVTANTGYGLKEMAGNSYRDMPYPFNRIHLAKGACREVDFSMVTDGKLAGRVTTAKGRPASFVKVAIIPTAPVRPQFAVVTDTDGRFEVGGRQAGNYLIGVGLLEPYNSARYKSRVYYPGVSKKDKAKVINLGDGEWRTDIDFKVPSSIVMR